MVQKMDFAALLSEIRLRAGDGSRFVIAISGFGGSGKSTTAEKLAAQLGDAIVIHLDDFIVDRLSVRSEDWEGFDWGRLTNEVLDPIAQGAEAVEHGVYDWKANAASDTKKVALKKYVVIEGVGLIRERLQHYFDLTVWLDVPLDAAWSRGKRRDVKEYGLPHHADLWDALWSPNDRDYFAKYKPNVHVDFLLEN